MATRTALKLAAAGSSLVLLATATPALAQIPGPPPPPHNPSSIIGMTDLGITGRDPNPGCTAPTQITLDPAQIPLDPAQIPLPVGQLTYALTCDYRIFTADNKMLLDTEYCINQGRNWIFIGLKRWDPNDPVNAWTQFTRSYLDPNRIDVPAPCILG